MKLTLVFVISLVASQGLADQGTSEITFQRGGLQHTYTFKNKRDSIYLSFRENRKVPIEKEVDAILANDLISELNRIVWKSMYRKPASQKACSTYAVASVYGEKPISICRENRMATAQAYGFLNKLNGFFASK